MSIGMTIATILIVAIVIVGCAAPQRPGATQSSASGASAPKEIRRVTAAIVGNPATVNMMINTAGSTGKVPGADEVEDLLNARLGMMGQDGVVRPQLAETIPTIENGLWTVLTDGRMEMTWKISSRAHWHDGVAFTAEDLVFTRGVQQERDMSVFRDTKMAVVESVEAPDSHTLLVRWRQPFILADNIFEVGIMPKHLLEPYLEDKATFAELPYWRHEFVGTGPYRLREWAQGSHATLVANDGYVLGRPKIDEILVRFIPDPNTLLANVLSGEVDLTMGLGISLDQAIEVREQWRNGRAEVAIAGIVAIYPQLLWPTPQVVGEPRFRRALVHAMDRQAMADTMMAGLSSVAHSFIGPNQPEYRDIEHRIVRYAYDPRRAVQTIEDLGYLRGSDGFFRDSESRRLSVEIRSVEGFDINLKSLFPIADAWQRVGVAVDPVVTSRAKANDREYRATFPGFDMTRNPNYVERLLIFHSSQMRLPENNYVGSNYMNYKNTEWDGLIDTLFATIPSAERTRALGNLVHFMTDQLLVLGIIYMVDPYMIANRVVNMAPPRGNVRSPEAWNAHEWDLRP